MLHIRYRIITQRSPNYSTWLFVKETDCRDDTVALNVQVMWKQRCISSKLSLPSVPASSNFTDPQLHPPIFKQGGAGGKNILCFFFLKS